MSEKVCFEGREIAVLRTIVAEWVGEGFTTPPYSDTHYGIFEKLGGIESHDYDTSRPAGSGEAEPS